MTADRTIGLRELKRAAVKDTVTEAAMRLFLVQGFDNTSVEQIAAAVGISSRSFFRYFGTKEDVVLGHLAQVGLRLQSALRSRPLDEDPWTALRRAFDVLLTVTEAEPDVARTTSRMLLETPSLRARHLEKQLHWQELLVPDIERRIAMPRRQPDARANAIVAAALSCLDAANTAWTLSDQSIPLSSVLDDAIRAIRTV